MSEHHFQIPMTDADVKAVRVGDMVYFSGEVWTSRSRVQKAVFDEGRALPFSTAQRNVLIHAGPVIKEENGQYKIISFAPTTSIRFEKWGAKSIAEWQLKAIVGKATMGEQTLRAMQEHRCIHASPIGVTTNLFLSQVKVIDVHWKKEFGSIESAWLLQVQEYGPFIVDMDCYGNNYFDQIDAVVQKKKLEAFKYLGIPPDFEYTRLY
jgi:fumarate hydratase subunit beta